jgi:hypothetical protein
VFWPPGAGSVFSSEGDHTAWSTRGLQHPDSGCVHRWV